MRPLVHYPQEARWWRPQRCACGLRLWKCPDWREALRHHLDYGRTHDAPYAPSQP
jgi:hypothetical protein